MKQKPELSDAVQNIFNENRNKLIAKCDADRNALDTNYATLVALRNLAPQKAPNLTYYVQDEAYNAWIKEKEQANKKGCIIF